MGTPSVSPHQAVHTRGASALRNPPHLPQRLMQPLQTLLQQADIHLNGERPWDMQIHHPRALQRILAAGSLGLGEAYMDGDWDCTALDQFFTRVLRARLDEKVKPGLLAQAALARLFNPQSRRRAWKVGQVHYDTGNEFFTAMLDRRMTYTCGYWAAADNLDDAQEHKLDLICRKLDLRPGMRLLDIGCGWGSLMKFAAEHYGARCVGLTVSKEQAEHGQQHMGSLPVEFHLADYRDYTPPDGIRFDRVASVGMFEHVGHKNYAAFFDRALRCLKPDGLFLLHTIGKNYRNSGTDPWINRYIFPNGEIPSLTPLMDKVENRFVLEDLHNFGADYDHTLMAWHANFEQHWPHFAEQYGQRFYRMWRYYLLSCAGAFRARTLQLWQFVLSPRGLEGGYRRLS